MNEAGLRSDNATPWAATLTEYRMKHIFILNPCAGHRKRLTALKNKIRESAEKAGIEFGFFQTHSPEEVNEVVAKNLQGAKDVCRFYACGGDGTLSAVASAVANRPMAECALIPHGTGNDFARNFTHQEYFFDFARQFDGKAIRMDAIRCNDRYSINMVNIGFDCDVVAKTEHIKKLTPFSGSFAYIIGVLATFFRRYGTRMDITMDDGSTVSGQMLLSAIGNGGFCGGGFHSNPRAVLNDGLFDLCLVKKVSRLTFLRLIGLYKKGTHLLFKFGESFITYRQMSSLSLRFDKPTGICIDGEIMQADHADLSIAPRAVAFSLPVGCDPILPFVSESRHPDEITVSS